MNIYAPADLSGASRAPAVLFVHGGPIPSDFMPPTQWGVFVSYGELAAASGLVGVTFNHRLFALTDYERSQADVAAAIDYVRNHAAELNVDADRIALWYFSGGGPLMAPIVRIGQTTCVAFLRSTRISSVRSKGRPPSSSRVQVSISR